LHGVFGHELLLGRLATSLASGRLPQTSLLVGPPGVGKQRVALWAAQGVLCDRGPGAPCGDCPSCGQVGRLGHPDLHWFIPIPRPKSTEADRQVEEARQLLGEAVAERRANPVYGRPDGLASHALASVRLLHRVVSVRPFQGPRRMVIVGNADRLVVQEASQEAANALLKVLEEPPPGTYLMLTTSEPQALLPTVRSRLVPIRVGGVGDEAVRRFLAKEVRPPLTRADLERRVLAAEGSIGRALTTSTDGGAEGAAERVLEAAGAGPGRSAQVALAQAPWAARGEFTATLDALARRIRGGLVKRAEQDPPGARRLTAALREVEEIRAAAQGNANPQLALAVLTGRLRSLAA